MKGLSQHEVSKLQHHYGLNVLKAVNRNPWWKMLLAQFTDLLVLILIGSAMIAIGMSLYEGNQEGFFDGAVILGIVLINAGIGFFQEFKTEKALEALKKMLSPQAVVIRDGEKQLIKAEEIVPGDIVVMGAGDKVPADGRLVEAAELKSDEAPLTGESVPVEKKISEQLFMGTTVVAGSGLMEVTAIGMQTEFGKIAHLTTETVQDKSPLQKEMHHIGLFVTKITLFLSAILIAVGILVQGKHFLESLLFAVSVAVAAVPEGLPATITVALALGVQRMVRRHVIVKKLSSIETLGATTVICSDKTGTLTKNEMTVTRLLLGAEDLIEVYGSGYDPQDGAIGDAQVAITNDQKKSLEKLRLIATYCTEAVLQKKGDRYQVLGDPTEGALLTLAQKDLASEKSTPLPEHKVTDKIPFDSTRKLMSVILRDGELWTKGSPDEILERSTAIMIDGKVQEFTPELKSKIREQNEAMAKDALRVIGFAYRGLSSEDQKKEHRLLEHELTFVGLAGMIDPPREEVPHAVALCKKAGIRTIVITGDHGLTAKAIAKQIGIADEKTPVILGKELDEMSDGELDKMLKNEARSLSLESGNQDSKFKIPDSLIFSRVSPENKRRIVDRLKQMGEIVAVTGDGVNDAPALKRADLGIAMGITGTEVSKETANMILLDDSFASIVKAVEEGRKIYANLKKFTWFVFSCNFCELFVVFTAIILNIPAPLTAILILAVNVGTDILPAIALGVDHAEPSNMLKPPRSPKLRIMNRSFVMHFVLLGVFMGALIIGLFLWKLGSLGWEYGQQWAANDPLLIEASTFAFVLLVMLQLFNAFNARSFEHSLFRLKPLWQLWGACLVSVALVFLMIIPTFSQALFDTTPLSAQDWLIIVGAGFTVILAEEVRKLIMR